MRRKKILTGEKNFFTAYAVEKKSTLRKRNSYKNSSLNSPLILQNFVIGKVVIKTCKNTAE